MPRQALGRGLEALIPDSHDRVNGDRTEVYQIAIDAIHNNPYQPRTSFHPDALRELAQSIVEQGILQPLVVRRSGSDYELIAGQRRLEASRLAGLLSVPALIRSVDDRQMLECALVENLQREDLNAIDEANAYDRLMRTFGLTQAEVADRVGRDRSTVANSLRLLRLPDRARDALREGKITAGHARAIMAVEDGPAREVLLNRVLDERLSARQVEDLARTERPNGHARSKGGRARKLAPEFRELEDRFRNELATEVRIRPGRKGGKIEISYYADEDLERIIEIVLGRSPVHG